MALNRCIETEMKCVAKEKTFLRGEGVEMLQLNAH